MEIEMKKAKVMPIYLDMSMLDVTKTLMYEFWYNYIKAKWYDYIKPK